MERGVCRLSPTGSQSSANSVIRIPKSAILPPLDSRLVRRRDCGSCGGRKRSRFLASFALLDFGSIKYESRMKDRLF